jgi:hypothetical protein
VFIQFFILAEWNVDTFSGSHFKKVGEKKMLFIGVSNLNEYLEIYFTHCITADI